MKKRTPATLRSEWEKRHEKSLGEVAGSKNRLLATTADIPLDHVYGPSGEDNFEKNVGFPGEYPFTRGIHPTMYRARHWTMRQYAGFGTAKETNERYRYLLNHGTTGLSVAFDLPTQMGRDSDDARAKGEVGKVGVAIDSIDDMETLFSEIPLDKVSTSMTINATAHILLALYLVVGERRGIAWNKLRGTVQNDVLKEFIARGTYIYPPGPSLKIATDIIEFCKDNVPEWNTISISGYHIREAGSDAAQELAFTFADGITYVESVLKRGLDIESFAPRLAFFFNCHNNLLEEVAKFRAARRMWAKIMRERFGAKSDRACMLRFHTQTAGSSLTAQQPLNNVVRTTLQAIAAVCGGTQSLHTNAYDEALGLPTDSSAALALRTQQVIANESGLADVVDPFGGSYAVEALTDELEKRATAIIERIDSQGGMLRAIELGVPQKEIEESAYRYQKLIEEKKLLIVGVNSYQNQREEEVEILKVDPRLEAEQCERLKAFRAKRDNSAAQAALRVLDEAAVSNKNLLPAVVECVRKSVTLGEISQTLKSRFGEY